jgi:hypothetical protein
METVNSHKNSSGLAESRAIPLRVIEASAPPNTAIFSANALFTASKSPEGVGTVGDCSKVQGAVMVSSSSLLGFLSHTCGLSESIASAFAECVFA